jgi:hypothetical protein
MCIEWARRIAEEYFNQVRERIKERKKRREKKKDLQDIVQTVNIRIFVRERCVWLITNTALSKRREKRMSLSRLAILSRI